MYRRSCQRASRQGLDTYRSVITNPVLLRPLIADATPVFQDVKPDNILVDWAYDDQGQPKVDKVALGDFDLALKLVDERPLRAPHAVGNVMWRSPEGQSGKGVAKASDVYSLGLVVGGPRSLST